MMDNQRAKNMESHKNLSSPNAISNSEHDSGAAAPSKESPQATPVITGVNGSTNQTSFNAIRPPLPPPHLPLPPTGALPTSSISQQSSGTVALASSSRSSGARSSSRSSHHRRGNKGSDMSSKSKRSSSEGNSLRPKACRLCGQPHSHHEPHLYNYRYLIRFK